MRLEQISVNASRIAGCTNSNHGGQWHVNGLSRAIPDTGMAITFWAKPTRKQRRAAIQRMQEYVSKECAKVQRDGGRLLPKIRKDGTRLIYDMVFVPGIINEEGVWQPDE